jgi:hypothetical protein
VTGVTSLAKGLVADAQLHGRVGQHVSHPLPTLVAGDEVHGFAVYEAPDGDPMRLAALPAVVREPAARLTRHPRQSVG